MNLFRWVCLLPILVLSLPLAAQDTTGMRKYETENPEFYREPVKFAYPKVEIGEAAVISGAPTGESGVRYEVPEKLTQAVEFHKRVMGSRETFPGFRIQILTTADLKVATDTKSSFIQSNQTIAVYQSWDKTHFRIRVGDFLTRQEAMSQLAELRKTWPGAFVVEDQINAPKLKPAPGTLSPAPGTVSPSPLPGGQ